MSGFVDTLRAGTNQFRRKFSKKNSAAQSVSPLKIDAADDAFFGKMRMEDLETALNQLPDVHTQRPNSSLLASEPLLRESLVTPTTPQGTNHPHPHPHPNSNSNSNRNIGAAAKSNANASIIMTTTALASPSSGSAAAYIYPHSTLQRPYVATLQPQAYETHRPIIQFPNALQPKTEDNTHLNSVDPDLTLQPMFPDRSVENLHQLNQVLLSTSSPTAGAGATISSSSTGYNDNPHHIRHTASSTTSSTSSELPNDNRLRMTAAAALGSSSSLSSQQQHQHQPAKPSLLASSKNTVRRVSMPPEANGAAPPTNFEEFKFQTKLQPRSISESILSFDPTTNAALVMQEDEGLAEEFERANSAPWAYDPNAMEGLDGTSYETESQPPYPDLVLNSIHKDGLHGSPGQQFDELLPKQDFRNSNSSLINAMKKYDDDVPMAFDASFFGSRDVIEEDDAFPSPSRSHASKFASQQSSIHASPHRQAPSSLRTPKSMFGNLTLFSPSNAHQVHYQQQQLQQHQNLAGSAGLNSLGSTPRSSNVSGISTPSKGSSMPGTPTSAVSKKAKRKPKTYSNKDPSLYCHICARDSRRVPVVVCSNYTMGTCRKVVCKSCFEKFEWDFESATRDGSIWVCSHCLESCPESARCHIYDRINAKRAK